MLLLPSPSLVSQMFGQEASLASLFMEGWTQAVPREHLEGCHEEFRTCRSKRIMATIPMDLIRRVQPLALGIRYPVQEMDRAGNDRSVCSYRLSLPVLGVTNAWAKRLRLRVSSWKNTHTLLRGLLEDYREDIRGYKRWQQPCQLVCFELTKTLRLCAAPVNLETPHLCWRTSTRRHEGHGIVCLRWQKRASSPTNVSDSSEHIRIIRWHLFSDTRVDLQQAVEDPETMALHSRHHRQV